MDQIEKHVLWLSAVSVPALYLAIGGVFYLFLYAWKRNPFQGDKIQQVGIARAQVRREVFLSAITLSIFCFVGFLSGLLVQSGKTLIYFDASRHSDGYFMASILVAIFLHDFYFYWTHRMLHLPGWFGRIHLLHHRSSSPNPLSALAFHPVEAIVQAAFFPLILVALPIHPVALFVFLSYMVFMNVLGHSGFQLFHYGKALNRWLWWNNSSRRHDDHHQMGRGNYGLYFTFWDRWMKTSTTAPSTLTVLLLFAGLFASGQNRHLTLGVGDNGICFGNSVNSNGFRLNWWDRQAGVMNGLNLSGVTGFERSNGISVGILGAEGTLYNGIQIGLASLPGQVNGLALAFGVNAKKINGIEVGMFARAEIVNGFIAALLAADVSRDLTYDETINGLMISLAGATGSQLDGVALSLVFTDFQAVHGLAIGIYNNAAELHGIQLGVLNHAANNKRLFRWLPLVNVHLGK
jgi:sterol desaturase/sphingolipid hydroxylase (fatty acid hydroxylase superfamily)